MHNQPVDYEKGETPMTDYQFQRYEALPEERDALREENEL